MLSPFVTCLHLHSDQFLVAFHHPVADLQHQIEGNAGLLDSNHHLVHIGRLARYHLVYGVSGLELQIVYICRELLDQVAKTLPLSLGLVQPSRCPR